MFQKLTDNKPAKQEIGKRFARIRECLALGQKEMAAHFGLTQGCIAHFEKGTVIPGPGHLRMLNRKFHVDITWLLYGRGSMFRRSGEPNEMYRELYEQLEQAYKVPEVALVLDAKLLETKKLFKREIAEHFTSAIGE